MKFILSFFINIVLTVIIAGFLVTWGVDYDFPLILESILGTIIIRVFLHLEREV